jgi:hypothetical protein
MPFMTNQPFAAPRYPAPPAVSTAPELPDFSELDQETLNRLTEMWGLSDREAALLLQQEQADALAETPAAEGRTAGRVYVAANPLEHLASAGRRIAGLRKQKKLAGEREQLGKERVAGHRAAYNLYGANLPLSF